MKIGVISGKLNGTNQSDKEGQKQEKELKLLDGKSDKIDFKKNKK